MRTQFRIISLLLLVITGQLSVNAQLLRSKPEAQGVPSAAISSFIDAANKSSNEFHSFILAKNGHIIAESWWKPYAPELKHTMYSVSKSFTSTAIGLAVAEGRIKVSDKVVSFFPSELPGDRSALLESLTIKDLITMSAGQSPDPTRSMLQQTNWVNYFLGLPMVDTPGTRFLYNSAATFMLSAIIQKVTGEKLADYLKNRLFDPLEIYHIDWELNPEEINSGGWGLRLKTSDMAKFGQLYLQKGLWNGKQVLPADWVEEATSFKIKNAPDTAVYAKATSDWAQGYCYQFWRSRNNAYRADGAFGQYIIVMPEQNAVMAITSETSNMQDIMNLVWEHLLPALSRHQPGIDKKTQKNLTKAVKNQILKIPAGVPDPTIASAVSGKNFALKTNAAGLKNIRFNFKEKGATVTIETGEFQDELTLKKGKWEYGTIRKLGPSLTNTTPPSAGTPGFKVATAYTWKDDNTLLLTIRYIESPHTETFVCTFENNSLRLRIDNSIKGMNPGGNNNNEVIEGSF
ncbi:MAG: serine hydrolase [Chitinophagaceae bacterium]|nr:serine hydrolase [Chitinophagaceae bacterium]MCW5928702.1 serine hydrolase [Chitinophagaceae bacterium]